MHLRQPFRPRVLLGVQFVKVLEVAADLGELGGEFRVGVARRASVVAEVLGQDLGYGLGPVLAGVGGVAVKLLLEVFGQGDGDFGGSFVGVHTLLV